MIRILVDSASDIQINNAENIIVVPLSININNKNYLDGVELGKDQFYDMLTSGDVFPKTSQPSPQQFVEEYEKIKEAGDELICIMLSSGVSGTYQSACIARDLVEYDNIHVVDSITGAYGCRLLAIEAQRLIEQGKTCVEIVEALNELKKRIQVVLVPEVLDYLYKGGRLDKKSAIIGNLAKIKPIIEVSDTVGRVEVLGKAIGNKKAMNKIVELVQELEYDSEYPFYTIYTKGTKNVEALEKKLAEANIPVSEREHLGPVVGTHLGPEAYGAIFVHKKY